MAELVPALQSPQPKEEEGEKKKKKKKTVYYKVWRMDQNHHSFLVSSCTYRLLFMCYFVAVYLFIFFISHDRVRTRLQQYYTQCLLESRYYYFVVLFFPSFSDLLFPFLNFKCVRDDDDWIVINIDSFSFSCCCWRCCSGLSFFLWLFSLLYNDSRDRFDCYGGDGSTR